METELEPGSRRVVGDRTRLAEALSLLLTGAAGGTGQDTPLRISTARDGGRAVIRIAPRMNGADAVHAPTDATAQEAADTKRSPTGGFVVASRLVEVQGGEVRADGEDLEVRIGRT